MAVRDGAVTAAQYDVGELLGRSAELAELGALFVRGARWVTLVGLGGVGKSRLAFEVAGALSERSGRTLIVCECVGIEEAAELALALAGRIDRAPLPGLDIERELIARLRSLGPALALIDNLEHLVTKVGPLLRRLLAAVPGLAILATSRLPFELPEEVAHPLLPLVDDGPDSPAVALLRARSAGPRALPEWQRDLDGLAHLAHRLDGIPLALELAAARAHLITPRDLDALLDLRFTLEQPLRDRRQSTRDAAIEWAWSHLSARERAALGRLSVLAGAFDLELALALLDAPRAEAFALFEQLARFSLVVPSVQSERPRYRILETVRELALSRIGERERDDALTAMAEALLARFPRTLDPLGHVPPETSQAASEAYEHLLAVLRRGRAAASRTSIENALRAGAILFALFQRTGFELPLIEMVKELLELPASAACSADIQLAAGLRVVLALANSGDPDEVSRLIARLERCVGADALADARLRVVRAAVCHFRWDYRGAVAALRSLADSPIVAMDPVLSSLVAQHELVALRALGRVELDSAERRLIAATSALEGIGQWEDALRCRLNRTFLLLHLDRADVALSVIEGAEVARATRLIERFSPYVAREKARAEAALGRRGLALQRFDEALARFDDEGPRSTQAIETRLDRAATAIEAGEYEAARGSLGGAQPTTSFARGYHEALTLALASLSGPVPEVDQAASWARSDTVEDEALRIWALIAELQRAAAGDAPLGPLEALLDSAAAPFSFRVRQAQRVARAAFRVASASPGVLATSTDRSAFRLGATWVDLTTMPLLQRLVSLVVARARLGEPALAREDLSEALWAGERMTARSRSNRLSALLASLAGHGLELASDPTGVSLPAELDVLVVCQPLWPGLGVFRRRGRGRPRKNN